MNQTQWKLNVDAQGVQVPVVTEIDLGTTVVDRTCCSLQLADKATGVAIPCQFTPDPQVKSKGTLSFVLPHAAQNQLVLTLNEGHCDCCDGQIIDRGNKQLALFFGSEHLADYVFNEAYERPFVYPVIGPDGLCVTREVPVVGDHPHHKGISFNIGEVSSKRGEPGVNFWASGTLGSEKDGRVIHQEFSVLEQGPVFLRIVEKNIWKQNDVYEPGTKPPQLVQAGEVLLHETRTITFWNVLPSRMIDMETSLTSAVDEAVFNEDTAGKKMRKENGPLLVRVSNNMRGSVEGTIVNSEGGRGESECWGRSARWVDYYGPVIPSGPVNGIAVLDHPTNLRYPTGWHVRDYGLLAPNIFNDQKPEWPEQGPVYLSKGESINLKYRVCVHRGDERDGLVEQKWSQWANPAVVTIEQ